MKDGLSWENVGFGPMVTKEDLDTNSIRWGRGHVCRHSIAETEKKIGRSGQTMARQHKQKVKRD